MKTKIERNHAGVLLLITLSVITLLLLLPPIAQPAHYHDFADQRTFAGIPNFMNVLSNGIFVLVGLIGFRKIYNLREPEEFPRTAMLFFFAGVFLTGFGSAYYHWAPDAGRLIWDRLPMTITFMALLSAVVSLHMENWSGHMLLYPLLMLGVASVGYWHYTELRGHGDLRPYIFVQFYPMVMIPALLYLFPAGRKSWKLFVPVLGFYIAAKYFEYADADLYAFGKILSGHTLKHLLAGMAVVGLLNIYKFYQVPQTKNV
jgi:hypothetical protein